MIGIVIEGAGWNVASRLDLPNSKILNGSRTPEGPGMSVELLVRACEEFLSESPQNIVIGISTSGFTFSIAANKANIPAASCGTSKDVEEAVAVQEFNIRFIETSAAKDPLEIQSLVKHFERRKNDPGNEISIQSP